MNIQKITRHLKIFLVIVCFSLSIGCGDSDNDIKTGQFIDSPVEGLTYSTPTQSGISDKNGSFRYKDGEVITFAIGALTIGQAVGSDIVTPLDLVEEAIDYNHRKVLNISRLMQSLDCDCNPENGIYLGEEIISAVENLNIDFSISSDDFTENEALMTLLINLESNNYFTGCSSQLVSSENALRHLRESMASLELRADMVTVNPPQVQVIPLPTIEIAPTYTSTFISVATQPVYPQSGDQYITIDKTSSTTAILGGLVEIQAH